MATGPSGLICGICGDACALTDCKVDERGQPVHDQCKDLQLFSLKDLPFQKPLRHQCAIYEGAPSRTLSALADLGRQKLNENHRCHYLNTAPMIAGIRACLAARGVDVDAELQKGSLMFTSEQTHLVAGRFDIDRMIRDLEAGVNQALNDGYKGLWVTGDMSWEFGPHQDFSAIVEYEWRLEQVFQECPQLCGVCQYHRDTLPQEVMRHGLITHESIFVNDTLSRVNPRYVFQALTRSAANNAEEVDQIINQLCRLCTSLNSRSDCSTTTES
jgi:MEDS: MEthanogen/methylotroph, DcmR Sensory domain